MPLTINAGPPPRSSSEFIFGLQSPVPFDGAFLLNVSNGNQVNIWFVDDNGVIITAPTNQTFTVTTTYNATVVTPTVTIEQGQATASTLVTSEVAGSYLVTVIPGNGPLSGLPQQQCIISFEPDNMTVTDACVNGITRPYLRDAIRRKMGFTPPVDTRPSAQVGDAPPGESWPGNTLINQAISDAIRKINAKVQFNVETNITINVPATANQGIQFFPLQGVGGQSNQNAFNALLRCIWLPSSTPTTEIRLIPRDFRQFDRRGWGADMMDNTQPGQPRYVIMQGYQLGILPPSNQPGTLQVWANVALQDFCSDTDLLPELPIDYASVIEDLAVVYCNMMNTTRTESANQVKLYGARAADGMADLIKWKGAQNELVQPNLTYGGNYRRGNRFV